MTKINDLLSDSSPAGKRIRTFFNSAFGAGFGAVGKLLDGGTLTKIFRRHCRCCRWAQCGFQDGMAICDGIRGGIRGGAQAVIVAVGPLLAKVFGDLGTGPNPTVIKIIQIVAEGLGDVVIVLGAVLAVAGVASAALFAFQAVLSAIAFAIVKYVGNALGWLWTELSSLAPARGMRPPPSSTAWSTGSPAAGRG